MKPTPLSLLSALALVLWSLPASSLDAQEQSSPPPPRPNPANGPWTRDVIVYSVAGSGEAKQLAKFPRAGVPTLARLTDGRLIAAFQHFPENDTANFDRIAVAFSSDEGRTWTKPQPISVSGMEEGLMRPFDPTLVPLPDGQIRLYFTSNRSRDFQSSKPEIYSAISRDGLAYTFEPGVRFGVPGKVVIDCAVVLHDGEFHLYSPDNGTGEGSPAGAIPPSPSGTGYHATSPDGLIFERAPDVTMTGSRRWLGNAQSHDGQIVFFGTGDPGGIWTARSRDGASWDSPTTLKVMGADPGAVAAREAGGWIVAVTGPSVPGRDAGSGNPQPPGPRPPGPNPPNPQTISVERIDSAYPAAAKASPGNFATGQPANLVLGAFGFNQSGGGSALNHPTGLATDGQRLLVADRWNNRVLVWSSIPATNEPPHLVLGQKDFATNDPGRGLDSMNWPGNVSVGSNGRVAVTDTNNDRVLLWNAFPTTNGQPADLAIRLESFSTPQDRQRLEWPWGVWTDGTKLAVVATRGAAILVWNSWPSSDTQSPDQILRPEGLGTPRNITSDGTFLMVSDHNFRGARPLSPQGPGPRPGDGPDPRVGDPQPPRPDGRDRDERPRREDRRRPNSGPQPPLPPGPPLPPPGPGPGPGPGPQGPPPPQGGRPDGPATLVWNTWPQDSQTKPDFIWPEWVKGTTTADGRFILAGAQSISIWDKRPTEPSAQPALRLMPPGYRNGDGPDAVVAGGRLFVCNYNGSNVLAWHSVPQSRDTPPDFALGSETPNEDVWAKRFFIQNPIVATNGESLFASSDFDRKLFVWKKLPGQSSAKPDLVYHLPTGPWDNALHRDSFVLGGKDTLYIWKRLPTDGQLPDVVLRRRIGPVELREITGVAIDQRHLYVADRQANRVYVWKGIPREQDRPDRIIEVPNPGRMSSDGRWLTIAPFEGQEIFAFSVDRLQEPPKRIGGRQRFNLPGKAIVAGDRLFVADTGFNRVQVWNDLKRAFKGEPSDAILGAADPTDRSPGIGQTKLFMPGSLAYDGASLWVGEFKFSTRILRFTPPAP